MNREKRVITRLTALFIVFIFLIIILYAGVPYAFGCDKPFMVVVSRSMEPTIHVNDLIVIRGINILDVKVGDIIVFKSPINPNMYIVHRVVDIIKKNGEIFLKTKGDNNPLPDPWLIGRENLIGKVIFIIPYVGVVARVLIENPTLKIAIISIIIILIIYLEYRDLSEERMMKS
jgi:signal peptidase